ncbi:MAG TPA: flavin reductase family protein [Chloroflexia bacterium]|nr:flavin reductase family protein [Chloroflexia bacterium]
MSVSNNPELKAASSLLSALYRDSLVLITSAYQDRLNGQIALAALPASIVPEKPRLLIELWQNNFTHDLIKKSGVFTLHLLRPDQLELLRTFGFYHGHNRNKFSGLSYKFGSTGSPFLEDSLGWLECRVIGQLPTEDMTAFIGEVVAAWRNSDEEALTWTKARELLPKDWLDEYNASVRRQNEDWARQRLGIVTGEQAD